MPLSIEEWDKYRPLLWRVQDLAKLLRKAVEQLPSRPEWRALAEEELELAYQEIKKAKEEYQSKPMGV